MHSSLHLPYCILYLVDIIRTKLIFCFPPIFFPNMLLLRQRLEPQMNMEEVQRDREAQELWGRLIRQIPKLFHGT